MHSRSPASPEEADQVRHFTFPDILVTLLAVASWILVTLMAWAIFATS
jgi:hypothetical protein